MTLSPLTIGQMLDAGVHFGHQTRHWHPKMAPYIYSARSRIHIINLEKTIELHQKAMRFLSDVVVRKGVVLFVGTKRACQPAIQEEAERCGMPYVDHRWLGGMLTNFRTIRQSVKKLKELERMRAEGVMEQLTKKEGLQMARRLHKLQCSLGGVKEMHSLPDAVFVVDVSHEHIAVQEASRLQIPLVGVVDTNSSPVLINYPIPGNDDAVRAVQLYLRSAADVILNARQSLEPPSQDAPAGADDFVELQEGSPREESGASA